MEFTQLEKHNCICQKQHHMDTQKIVVEPDCLQNLRKYAEEIGLSGPMVAVYDENTYEAVKNCRPDSEYKIVLCAQDLHPDEKAVKTLTKFLQHHLDVRVMAAVGSGTIHDLVRYVSYQRGIPFVSCPTAASVDGFCSCAAVMTFQGKKTTFPAKAPVLVVADLNVIRHAPMRYTLSGVGDMLGKYISLADWKIAHLLTNEYFCPYLYSLTWQALERVRNSCLQLRTGSLNAFRDLTEGLLLSGLSIQMCGNTRPASGAEHHISHALEMGIPVYSDAMHGEKVAVGTCLCAEVYRSIAKIEDISPLVLPYTPISGCFLKNISPELQEFILQENVDDCLAAVDPLKLTSRWSQCREILFSIPDSQQLLILLQQLGCVDSLKSIGVSEDLAEELIQLSPCVRNRLTFMRVLRMIMVPSKIKI